MSFTHFEKIKHKIPKFNGYLFLYKTKKKMKPVNLIEQRKGLKIPHSL